MPNQFSHLERGICRECGRSDPSDFRNWDRCGRRNTICKYCEGDRAFTKRFGATYNELVDRFQIGNVCGICLKPEHIVDSKSNRPHNLCVDHDHKCCKYGCANCIRGLLCRRCNYKLGQIEEEIVWVEWAFEYLGLKPPGGDSDS